MSWFVWLFTKLFCDVGWFCHFYHPLLPRFTFDIFMVQQKKMGNYQNQEMKLPQFQNIRWRDIPFHGFQMVNRTVGTVDSCISICLTSLVFTGQPDMFFRWPVRRFRKRESRHSFSVENGKKPLRSTRMNSVSTLAFFKPSLYEFVLRFFFQILGRSWKILEFAGSSSEVTSQHNAQISQGGASADVALMHFMEALEERGEDILWVGRFFPQN